MEGSTIAGEKEIKKYLIFWGPRRLHKTQDDYVDDVDGSWCREHVDHAGLSVQPVQWREHTFWPQANL
jgi:hypothetical protein